MKKVFLMLIAALMCSAALADDRPIDYNEFPRAAKAFITKHFDSAKVLSATVDDEYNNLEYTVYLNNNTKVEFDKFGNWTKVESKSGVPAAIVPAKITSYVSQNFEGYRIVKIDKNKHDYELELSNGYELKFDLMGNFERMDD